MNWTDKTYHAWRGVITEEGDDFDAVAIASLQYATAMIETALHHPEWAAGFVKLARGRHREGTPDDWHEITEVFPVEMVE